MAARHSTRSAAEHMAECEAQIVRLEQLAGRWTLAEKRACTRDCRSRRLSIRRGSELMDVARSSLCADPGPKPEDDVIVEEFWTDH